MQPNSFANDNLGNLIEGIQRLEKLQKEEYETKKESVLRQYPQLEFLVAVKNNPDIIKRGFDILVNQVQKLKYGCEEFVSSESFVEDFFSQFDN